MNEKVPKLKAVPEITGNTCDGCYFDGKVVFDCNTYCEETYGDVDYCVNKNVIFVIDEEEEQEKSYNESVADIRSKIDAIKGE
jgi:hypothetical protein